MPVVSEIDRVHYAVSPISEPIRSILPSQRCVWSDSFCNNVCRKGTRVFSLYKCVGRWLDSAHHIQHGHTRLTGHTSNLTVTAEISALLCILFPLIAVWLTAHSLKTYVAQFTCRRIDSYAVILTIRSARSCILNPLSTLPICYTPCHVFYARSQIS